MTIKEGERARRGALEGTLEVMIHGPSTPVPKQWRKFIPNPQNKKTLCDFLSLMFCELGKQRLPPGCTLVIVGGFKDGRRAVLVRHGHLEDVADLASNQEEADTR